MPLTFEDFADDYRDSGWSDAQQRAHLSVVSDILECIVRYYRGSDDAAAKILGIVFDHSPIPAKNNVESGQGLHEQFNQKAARSATRRDDT